MKVNGITGLCFKILGFEVFVKNHQRNTNGMYYSGTRKQKQE